MQAQLTKWGNSWGLRFSRQILNEVDWKEGQKVLITRDKKRIVIEAEDSDLDTLLLKITKDNLHGEVLTGPAKGKEIW